jgi:membrane-bound lytic murein transglycosylase B
MYGDVSPPLAHASRHNKIPSVKLLETVTGPSDTGLVATDGHGMGLMERAMSNRTGAILIAAALLCSNGPSQAQSQAPSSGNGVSNFLGNIFSGPKSGPAPAATPGPDGGPPPWSGEDGASGHPLMTSSAIREAAANFQNCVAAMWPDAARRNITQANFERFTAGLAPDLRIMDLMDSQPEFTKSIWDYLDILVNDNRLAKGREVLAKYKPQFDAVEKAYGVDRYAIASIWGI